MMSSALDRVPVDEITARARAVQPGRAVLTLAAAVLFGVGWLVAKSWRAAFFTLAWAWAAVRVGFEAAHGPTRGQQIAGYQAELDRLRKENARLGG